MRKQNRSGQRGQRNRGGRGTCVCVTGRTCAGDSRDTRKDIFNKNIGMAEGKPQPLLGILLIEAAKARAAIDVAAIAAAQVELPSNSIEDSEEALALIRSNGDDIAEVNALDKLYWI